MPVCVCVCVCDAYETVKDTLHHCFHWKSCFQNPGFPLWSLPHTQLTFQVSLCPTHDTAIGSREVNLFN